MSTLFRKMLQRRDTAAALGAVVLNEGELGYFTDTKQLVIGDGITAGGIGTAKSGAVTSSLLTMSTARILGRTTASTGAIEELSNVPATLGGTGQTVYTVGDFLYASTTTALSKLAIGTAGQALVVTAGVPAWGAVGVAGGGVGFTTYATGDILYASAANTLSKLAAGTNGHVLTLAGGVPTWAAASSAPGGSDTQVQFNDGGTFGGDAGMVYNKTTDKLTVGGIVSTGEIFAGYTTDSETLTPLIQAGSDTNGISCILYKFNATPGPNLFFRTGRGTRASPTAIQSGDVIGAIDFAGTTSTTLASLANVGHIEVVAGENFGANRGTSMTFKTVIVGASTLATRAMISGAGNLLVGTTSDTNLTGSGGLSVGGQIVANSTGWSSGAPYGNVALIVGNNVNDDNWGHLIVSDSTTTTGHGGRIGFAYGGTIGSTLSPFAVIRGVSEGANYGGLSFMVRPSGGTATEAFRILSTKVATFVGKLVTVNSATSSAGLNIPHGTAPSSPANGDIWTTTAGLYAHINGATVGPYGTGSGSGGTKTLMRWDANQNQPPGSNYAQFNTRNSIAVLDFDDGGSANEDAVFVGVIPEGADFTTGIAVYLHWMGKTATTGNVMWRTSFERCNTDLDADSFATAVDGAAAACNGTSGIITVTTINHSGTEIDGLTAGDLFRLKVGRNGTSGSDTMSGDAQLVAVEIRQR